MGIIQASIPLFFLLLAAELVWSQRSGVRALRLNDSLSDLSCGILSQLAGIFSKYLTLGIFIWVGSRFSLPQWFDTMPEWPDRSPLLRTDGFPWLTVDAPALVAWSAAFVLVDFCYYWSHRLSHEIHILWAGHVVHHSSEEYNLAVALRQSALHGLMTWVFYVPLAVLGVPWTVFMTCYALNLVYQFWIHTRAIGTLPQWAEYVFNTPSHHRVHHGVNPEYQDKNYGGVFIVFDRWFGTFEPEVAAPVYGITKPLRSWNPLWANMHVFVQIARALRHARTIKDAWQAVFGRPADVAALLPALSYGTAAQKHEARATSEVSLEKFDPPVPTPVKGFALFHFTIALGAAFVLLQRAAQLPLDQLLSGSFFVVVTLAAVGGVLERAQWARALETARLVTLSAAIIALGVAGVLPIWLSSVCALVAVISLFIVWHYRQLFTERELAPIM